MISQLIINGIENAVKGLFEELGLTYSEELKIYVEQPVHLEHGDYSTNVAMQLAKALRKPPLQLANMLKNKLEEEGNIENLVTKVEVAPPGFINMFIN